jgi:hypothetical protein
MKHLARPQIGDWYRRLDKGESFQVIDVDQTSGEIEIQSFDGELDSLDLSEWEGLSVEPASAPQDWTGALEEVEPDDVTEDDLPSERVAAPVDVRDPRE